jgi:hypothetical protein
MSGTRQLVAPSLACTSALRSILTSIGAARATHGVAPGLRFRARMVPWGIAGVGSQREIAVCCISLSLAQ